MSLQFRMMRLHLQLLWLSGVPLLQQTKKRFLNIIGKIVCFLNVETLAFLIYSQIYSIWETDDLDVTARAFIMVSAGINSIFKIPHLLLFQSGISKLVVQVEDTFGRKDFLLNSKYGSWIMQCVRRTNFLLILSFILAFGASSSLCLMPIIWYLNDSNLDANGSYIRELPYLCHLPFQLDCKTSPFYEFIYGHQFLMGSLAALTTIAADLLPITFLMHATVQLKIIGEEMQATTDKGIVIKCIKQHQKLIKFIGNVEKIFNPMLMVQFLMSLLNFIFAAFKTINSESVGLTSNIGTLVFTIYNLWQLFIFCFFGELLMGKAISLANEGYSSGWMEMRPLDAILVKLFIQRAQQRLVVRVAVISKLDLDTFMNILRDSYSFLAVLNTMNN